MLIKFNLEKREFKLCPEGQRVMEITKAECSPSGKPARLNVTFKDVETGAFINSKYDFNNDKGLFAMAMLCKVALNMDDGDEFDTTRDTLSLLGKQLLCEVTHIEGTQARDDGSFPIFANVKKVIELVNNVPEGARNIIANNTPVGDDL